MLYSRDEGNAEPRPAHQANWIDNGPKWVVGDDESIVADCGLGCDKNMANWEPNDFKVFQRVSMFFEHRLNPACYPKAYGQAQVLWRQ